MPLSDSSNVYHHIPEAVVVYASDALYDGHQAAGAAAALNSGTALACQSVMVQNDPSNTDDVYVGSQGSQSVRLAPGDTESISVNDVSKVFVAAVSGTPRVNWHARS